MGAQRGVKSALLHGTITLFPGETSDDSKKISLSYILVRSFPLRFAKKERTLKIVALRFDLREEETDS